MSLADDFDAFERENPPHAKVQQVGRWRYRIYISHGMMQYGPGGYGWHRYGLERAKRKGARELAKYLRMNERHANVTEVR